MLISGNNASLGIYSNPQARSTSVGSIAAIVGLLLPYVWMEPAPVDVVLAVFAAGYCACQPVLRPAFILWLTYMSLSAIAIILSLVTGYANIDSVHRYPVIELYLMTGTLAIASVEWFFGSFARPFLRWYVIGAAVSSVLTIIIEVALPKWGLIFRGDYHIRVQGFFEDPNVLAPYLIFPVIAIAFCRRELRLSRRYYLALPMLLFLMYTTYSRGGYGACVAGFAAAAALVLYRELTIKRFCIFALATLAVGFIIILSLNYVDLPSASYISGRLELQSYDQGRFFHILDGFEQGITHPLGLGPGVYSLYNGGNNPHNLFVGKLTDAGLLPALMIVGIPVFGMIRSARLYLQTKDRVALTLSATLFSQLVVSMVIYSHHWRHLLILAVLGCTYKATCSRSEPVVSSAPTSSLSCANLKEEAEHARIHSNSTSAP